MDYKSLGEILAEVEKRKTYKISLLDRCHQLRALSEELVDQIVQRELTPDSEGVLVQTALDLTADSIALYLSLR